MCAPPRPLRVVIHSLGAATTLYGLLFRHTRPRPSPCVRCRRPRQRHFVRFKQSRHHRTRVTRIRVLSSTFGHAWRRRSRLFVPSAFHAMNRRVLILCKIASRRGASKHQRHRQLLPVCKQKCATRCRNKWVLPIAMLQTQRPVVPNWHSMPFASPLMRHQLRRVPNSPVPLRLLAPRPWFPRRRTLVRNSWVRRVPVVPAARP